MAACPNIKSQAWIELVNAIGIKEAFREFIKNNHEIPEASNYEHTFKGVNATTKVVGALMSKAGSESFDRFYLKGNKEKFFAELTAKHGATKQQVEQLKEWIDTNNPTSLEDLLTGLMAETTYAIEIETSVEKHNYDEYYTEEQDLGEDVGTTYSEVYNDRLLTQGEDMGIEAMPSAEEIERRRNISKRTAPVKDEIPTSHFSYLQVPGGVNYKEVAIRTPSVVNIQSKGGNYHDSDFNKSRGDMIGWFRGDDQDSLKREPATNILEVPDEFEGVNNYTYRKTEQGWIVKHPKHEDRIETNEAEIVDIYNYGSQAYNTNSKIRRILEVQSGFQKVKDVTQVSDPTIYEITGQAPEFDPEDGGMFSDGFIDRIHTEDEENLQRVKDFHLGRIGVESIETKKINTDQGVKNQNNFLRILKDENNWAAMFVQSIIQDSLWKGYEKVLFPTGNTAAKVEGHENIDQYVTYTEIKIAEIKEKIADNFETEYNRILESYKKSYNSLEYAVDHSDHELSDPPQDFYINPSITRTSHVYSRIRKNMQDPYPIDLVKDPTYKGWVLQNYTVGKESDITKISDERAEELLNKHNEISKSGRRESADVARKTYEGFKNNKEKFINDEHYGATKDLEWLNKELQDALAGRTNLSSIANFYEITIANILKKRGYNPTRITDKYGNTWNQVDLNADRDAQTIYFNREVDSAMFEQRALDYLQKNGLISSEKKKIGKGEFSVVSSKDRTISENVAKIEEINQDYADKYGWKPYVVQQIGDGSLFVVEVNKEGSIFSNEKETTPDKKIKAIASALSEKLGVEYEFVSTEKARSLTKNAITPWNGENAFFYQGKVYFVKGQATSEDVLHEFAHPFVLGIRKDNPQLYDKIYADIMQSDDPFFASVIDGVNSMYDDVSEEAKKDEVIVRVLQSLGSAQNKPEFKNIFQRIMFAIKQLLRKLFGQNINLDNLSTNTTLSELSEILYTNPTKVETKKEKEIGDVFFNREIRDELAQLKNDTNVKNINNFFEISKNTVRRLADEKNYGKLAELLITQGSDIPKNTATLLKLAQDFENNASMQQRKLENFAQAILSVEVISKTMMNHVNDMISNGTPEKDLLRTMRYYSFIVNDWQKVFDQLRQDNNGLKLPLLGDTIKNTIDNFKTVEDHIDGIYRKGLSQFFVETLAPAREAIIEHIDAQIVSLEEHKKNGKNVQERIDYYKSLRPKYDFDEPTVLKYLRGEMGDTNKFSAMLESYTSSPDPIVGGFAINMRHNFNTVLTDMQEFTTRLGNELAPHYKKAGIDLSDPEKLGNRITGIDRVFSINQETNKPEAFPVRVLLDEYSGGWLYDSKEIEHRLETARMEGNLDEEKKVRAELEKLREDYFHREYHDDVYEIKKFWDRDDTTRLAQARRKEITDKLRSYRAYLEMKPDDIDDFERLQKELRTLASTKNLDGTTKTGDDLAVARAIQEYNGLSKDMYEEVEIKNAFNRALDDFKFSLTEKGLLEDSDEYKSALNSWIKNNIRIRPTDAFYDEKRAIGAQIDAILSKIPTSEAQKMEIGKVWEEIIGQIKGFRDANGQPIGSELSEPKVEEIKRLQLEVDNIKDKFRKMNGLNLEEEAKLAHYVSQMNAGKALSAEQIKDIKALTEKAKIAGITKADKLKLVGLFRAMDDLQSRLPTEDYLDVINEKLRAFSTLQILPEHMENPLTVINMQEYLDKNAEFKDWFLKNHLIRLKWNEDTEQTEEMYERLYVWNRIVPNDTTLLNALRTNDFTTLVDYQSKYVQTKKASKYYYYKIKDSYKNERIVGHNVDNRGNWLPKTIAQGAKDDKYENKEFFKLKNSTSTEDQALFKILQTYKKYHLKSQEDAAGYTKLYHELPRIRRHKIEEFNAIQRNPGDSIKRILDYFKLSWSNKSKADDYDRGNMSAKDLKEQTKLYVSTDFWGDKTDSIPIKHMSKLDADKVSLDVGGSITQYAVSVRNNKMLHDINPVAHALQSVLEKEGTRDINKIARFSITKNLSINVKGDTNNRGMAINNMIDRDIRGVEHKMELGIFGQKVAEHIMKLAAVSSLSLNIPSGIKNAVAANIQNTLEAVGKQSYTPKDYANAVNTFYTDYLPKLIHDYNKFSGRGLQTQLFELFDPVEGKFEERLGHSFTASYKKDIVDLRFLTSPQKFGEISAQGSSMLAMMQATKIDYTVDGVTTKIPYSDAWMLVDGVVQVKPGVDPSWGRNGNNFLAFKMKLNKVHELLQGAYSKANQPEAARYTTFQLTSFMRRYLTPGIVNRFAKERPNFALGTLREGYYRTFFKVSKDIFQSKMDNWDTYSEPEKAGFFRSLTEIGYSLAFALLIGMMGYDNDDKNKNTKLRNSSWAHNMALYELIMIKGEAETFIPLPGMGMNEILRMKDNPSIAFPIMNKYYKVLEHFYDMIRDPFVDGDVSHYQRKTGIYEKGELRLKADLLRLVGYSGNTLHPEQGIKNYSTAMSRY